MERVGAVGTAPGKSLPAVGEADDAGAASLPHQPPEPGENRIARKIREAAFKTTPFGCVVEYCSTLGVGINTKRVRAQSRRDLRDGDLRHAEIIGAEKG